MQEEQAGSRPGHAVRPRVRPIAGVRSGAEAPPSSWQLSHAGADAVHLPGRSRWWRDSIRRRLLAVADGLAAGGASLVTITTQPAALWVLVFLPTWILIAKLLGLYDRDHRAIRHLTIDEFPQIVAWAAIGTATLAGFLTVTPVGDISTSEALQTFALAVAGALVLRSAARALWRRTTPLERSLIVGEGELVEQIERKLTLFKDMHLEPVGRVSAAELDADIAEGGGAHLDELMRDVERIIIATSSLRLETIAGFSAICRQRQVKMSVVSTLSRRAMPALRMTQVADLPIFEFNTWDVSRSTMVVKRFFDLAGAAVALLVTAPLVPLIALAIKLDSRGPVLFGQMRAGRAGIPFRMLKFRTMRADAEDALQELVRLDQLKEPMFKFESDPRTTRVGRVLRRLSLDELPQLLNVLRGQMSIVGPRPEQIELVELYRPEHRFRLDVKPGMTGPMQVNGRGNLTFEERLAVELDYVENLSLARDLRILALTLPAVAGRSGAF